MNRKASQTPRRNSGVVVLILLAWLMPALARAAVKTWDGSSNGNWATGANWVGGVAPVAGDDLVFPAGVARKTTTNNFAAGTAFGTVAIQDVGYVHHGNRVQLTGGASAVVMTFNPPGNGSAVVNFDLTLAGAAGHRWIDGGTGGTGNVLILAGQVDLNGHELRTRFNVRLAGSITGAGGLSAVSGETTLVGSTPNTYAGDTVSAVGTLILQKNAGVTAVPGRLVASGGIIEWAAAHQVSDTSVLALGNGTLELNGHAETVAQLEIADTGRINGGDLSTTGALRFESGQNTLRGTGRVAFPTGTHPIVATNSTNQILLELTGPGDLIQQGRPDRGSAVHLFAANTFTGTYALSNTVVYPRHAQALGVGPAGTFALRPPGTFNNAGIVLLTNIVVAGETYVCSSPGYPATGSLAALGGSARWNGNIVLPGDPDTDPLTLRALNAGDALTVDGVISGSGSVSVDTADGGRVVLGGGSPNTYTGPTHLGFQSRLELAKTVGPATPGDLRLGDNVDDNPSHGVFLYGPQQIGDNATVTILTGAILDLRGFNETIANMDLFGAQGFVLNGGTLTLRDRMRKLSTGLIQIAGPGRLDLSPFVEHELRVDEGGNDNVLDLACEISGAASVLKTGAGLLRLSGGNTFAGTFTIAGGVVEPRNRLAFGTTTAGTVVSNGATLRLGLDFAVPPPPETLELRGHGASNLGAIQATANSQWTGPVQVTDFGSVRVDAAATLTLSGAITAPEQLWKRGAGRLVLSGTDDNAFPGGFVLKAGAVDLAKTAGAVALAGSALIGDESTDTEELCQLLGPGQMDPGLVLGVPPTGRLRLNGFNATVAQLNGNYLNGGGSIELGVATLTLDTTVSDVFNRWQGVISGPGGFTKRGPGEVLFEGPNTYTGTTLVQAGTMRIRSHQPQSPVAVLTGALLAGDGTVGHLSVNNGGTLLPGHYAFTVATLTCSNLTLQPGSTNWTQIVGPEGHTRVSARGTVTLNQPTLRLDDEGTGIPPGFYLPKVGDEIIPIVNDGNDPVIGTFAGLPPGQFTGPGGLQWTISYTNDVVLRVLSQGFTGSALGGSNYLDTLVSGGNLNAYLDPNECAQVRIPVFNETSSNLPPFTAFLHCAVPGVKVHQPMAWYPALTPGQGAYGTNAFQITTPPGLFCGSNLPVTLVINAGGLVHELPLNLFVGAPEAAVRFDSTEVPVAINDGLTAESTLSVDDFPGWLADVEVEVSLTHPLTTDLHLELVAPGDVVIPLAIKAGPGANFGLSCATGQRTRFRMNATQSIGAAGAPFAGAFRPVGNLRILRSLAGPEVAGKWTLRVTDDTHFNTGTLNCWSLYLSPTACTDGGGACDLCPGLVAEDVDTDDPLTTQLPSVGVTPSVGYTNSVCSGPFAASSHYGVHTYSNHLAHPVAVTVTLTTACTNDLDRIHAIAYAGTFNPANVCDGFLGTSGYSFGAESARTFIFVAPAHTHLQIIVPTDFAGDGCKGYSLLVDGIGLCPVTLNLTALAADRMRLDWPRHAAGYELERTSSLQPFSWSHVTNAPVVFGERFVVTNEVANPTGFYRLRKP